MSSSPVSTERILSRLKIKALNQMQQASIAAFASQPDLVLLSDTGSGKTLAYLLPLLPVLDGKKAGTQAILIVPARELALQIEAVFKSMGTGLKVTCCYGGHLRETEENNLKEAPVLLIGTPGRLADHIRRGNITTPSIETLILDEFDKSLELGFTGEMAFIIGQLTGLKRRILISATETTPIPDFLGMKDPVKLDFLKKSGENSGLSVQILRSESRDKLETVFRLLCHLGNRSSIIFCNHRESVERTSTWLTEKGIVNVFYHGALEQQEREVALCKFRNGTAPVLVTTDLAARGLDITNIRYIIHYHIPADETLFTHRNGRTARMDASGTAILIIAPGETIPEYLDAGTKELVLPDNTTLTPRPEWSTLFIAAGKKDKVNKVDIVGFLTNRGQLRKEDIGLIEVKDYYSFVAVRKLKVTHTLQLIREQKIKNKKVKIAVAK